MGVRADQDRAEARFDVELRCAPPELHLQPQHSGPTPRNAPSCLLYRISLSRQSCDASRSLASHDQTPDHSTQSATRCPSPMWASGVAPRVEIEHGARARLVG